MRRSSILATVILAIVATSCRADEFDDFVEKFGRVYQNAAELAYRRSVFESNMRKIVEHNGLGIERYGINQFSDMTAEEFKTTHLKCFHPSRPNRKRCCNVTSTTRAADVDAVDWSKRGATTKVKEQGQCGACWAFSAVEQVESDHFFHSGKLIELSTQQVVECDTHGDDDGCDGGDPIAAYKYIMSAGGLDTESAYPYTSGDGRVHETCSVDRQGEVAGISGSKDISDCDLMESQMLDQIALSPMSVCVDADTWQQYDSGIIRYRSCGTKLNHCVQVVGYQPPQQATTDNDGHVAYWIVRNSWGRSWGVDGFAYVEYGGNVCGIAQEATVTVPTGYPSSSFIV